MALHAVDDLSDAYRATRSFLLPFEWGRWLRLAVLSLFVAGGSGGGTPPSGSQFSMDAGTAPFGPDFQAGMERIGEALQANLAWIVGLIVLIVLISLVFAWLASTFEFAFFESLRRDEVHVRQYVSEFSGKGTRLFAFRLFFGLGIAVLIGGFALLAVFPFLAGGVGATPIVFLILLAPVFFVLGILGSIVYVFTTAFVVPIMLLEDRGVLSAWGRFWGTFKREWTQFLVFLLVGLFVMIVFGILLGIATAIFAVVVAIPFAILAAALFFGVGATFTPVWIAIFGVPFLLILLVVGALVQVPVQTYLRYWALLVLGDVDEDLDLIPDQRAAVRGETETETTS